MSSQQALSGFKLEIHFVQNIIKDYTHLTNSGKTIMSDTKPCQHCGQWEGWQCSHRFTRMIPCLKQLPYEKRLEHLGLWTLEERRNQADLLEAFRMYKGWSTTPFDTLFTLSTAVSTRGYSSKLMKNRCRLELRRHFFLERVVNRWNGLDQHVIDSATLNSFKMGLDRIRKTSIGFFMDWLSAWPNASSTQILLAGASAPCKKPGKPYQLFHCPLQIWSFQQVNFFLRSPVSALPNGRRYGTVVRVINFILFTP